MSSDGIAIRVRDVAKHYLMFARPEDRLKQMVVPRLQRLAGRAPARYYRDFAALNGVSFDLKRGETVGIIGRNGSGKSTLLQIVCGTLRPTHGTVEVNGRIAALLELGAGFNPEFTGRENAYLNAAILGLSRAEIDDRFESIARFADIGDFIDQPVKTYSSGMYVRLAFATAINVDPDILVVDEALAVGDEAFSRKCFARIEQIKQRGGTILFVSHAAQTIIQLCTRAMLIDGGELILQGPPRAVTSQYQRLVNATPEAAVAIRNDIVAMREAKPVLETSNAGAGTPASGALALQESPTVQQQESAPVDLLDLGMVAHSVVQQEQRGATIRDVRVLTLAGEQVNVLSTGRRYVIEYWTDFSVNARDVGFGIGITTTTGVHLAGTQCRASRIKEVRPATSVITRIEFLCTLLPGHYFVTCHVRGLTDAEEVPLHRIVDAAMFRVAFQGDVLSIGPVDIAPVVSVTATENVCR
jgi:lipopolysaccharide transport system ATP-binding protein